MFLNEIAQNNSGGNPQLTIKQKQNLYRKVCGLTNAFEVFKVFMISTQIPIVYSAPVKGPKKVHDLMHISIHMH